MAILSRIEKKIDEASTRSTDWRSLENFTEPAFNIGLLLVATAITILSSAAPAITRWPSWISMVAGGLLAWWGVVFLKVPAAAKEFFVSHEDLLRSFFARFEQPKKARGLRVIRQWAYELGPAGDDARTALREAMFAAKVGLVWAAVFMLGALAFSLALAFVGFRRLLGTPWALAAIGATVAGYALLIYLKATGNWRWWDKSRLERE